MTADRILLVEDEETQSGPFLQMLEYRKYAVECARDLTEVRCLLPTFKPVLAIVDLLLVSADMADGFDVIRYVRSSSYAHMGLLAWTARFTDARDEIRALRNGADDFVRKDAEFGLIEARIEALLRRVDRCASI